MSGDMHREGLIKVASASRNCRRQHTQLRLMRSAPKMKKKLKNKKNKKKKTQAQIQTLKLLYQHLLSYLFFPHSAAKFP